MATSATPPQSRTPTPTGEFGANVGSHSGSNDGGGVLGPPSPSNSPPPVYGPLSDVIVVGDAAATVGSSSSSIATASTVTVNNPPPPIPPPYPSRRQAWNSACTWFILGVWLTSTDLNLKDLQTESCMEGEHQFRKYPTGNAFIYAVVFFPFGLLWLCWNREDICKRCGCHQGDSVALQDIRSPRRHPRNHVDDTAS